MNNNIWPRISIGDRANDLAPPAAAGVSVAHRAKPVGRATTDYAPDQIGLERVLNLFA